MPSFTPSEGALEYVPHDRASLTWCSWRDTGWRSTLLRRYDAFATVEEAPIASLDDQVIVLVTSGDADMEASDGGSWRASRHVPGRLAMTAPGRTGRLRWRTRSSSPLSTLHLYVPGAAFRSVAEETLERTSNLDDLPDTLGTTDAVVESVLRALDGGARAGASELYAESALLFLAVHLLNRSSLALPPPRRPGARSDSRVRLVLQYMRDNLALPLRLDDLAKVVGLSRYHLVHLVRDVTGQSPHRHLVRLRVESAQERLDRTDASVSEIAYLCGFSNPSHFAATFRRWTGTTPTAYRDRHRR